MTAESDSLTHMKIADVGASPVSRGGGKFDESKVKRDGQGQFASKASMLADKDAEWLKKFDSNKMVLKMMSDNSDQLDAILQSSGKSLAELGADPEAYRPIADQLTAAMNEKADAAPDVYASPSGTHKVEFKAEYSGSMTAKVVQIKKPLRHEDETESLEHSDLDVSISRGREIIEGLGADFWGRKLEPKTN